MAVSTPEAAIRILDPDPSNLNLVWIRTTTACYVDPGTDLLRLPSTTQVPRLTLRDVHPASGIS